jgi:biotin operon repressor
MKQIDVIRSLLMQGNSLTPMDALNNFGCFRLAARIKELREEGLKIETLKERKNGKSYAKYQLRNCQLELFK